MPGKRLSEQETYDKLAEYEKNKDYAGMARLVCDAFILEGNLKDNESFSMDPGFRRYFRDFGKRNGGVPSQEDKQTLKEVLGQVQKIRVDSIIHAAGEIEKWEKDISAGKIDELFSLKGDNKLAHNVAHDIVMEKDPQGVYVRAGVSALGNIMSEVSSGSKEWQNALRMDGDKTKEFYECTQRIQSSVIDGHILQNGSVDLETAHKYMLAYESGAPKAKPEGFDINDSIGFDSGEKLCTKMPERYKMLDGLKTAEDYENVIEKHEKIIEETEKIERTAKALGRESGTLFAQLSEETSENSISKNEKFKRMLEITENLSNIGTDYKVPMGGKKLPTKDVYPSYISKNLKELRQLSRDIAPEIDELDEKEQRVAQKAVKSITQLADNGMRHLKHVSSGMEAGTTQGKISSELKEIKFLERQADNRNIDLSEGKKRRAEADSRRKTANEIDDTIAQAQAAQKGVFFGSSVFDKSIQAMQRLSDAYNNYRDVCSSANVTNEQKREALEELQKAGLESKLAIERYFDRKKDQGKMDGNVDEKTQKRIDCMKRSMSLSDKVMKAADKEAMELDEKIAAEMNEKIAEEIERTNDIIDEVVGDRETRRSKNEYERMINNAAADGAHLLAEMAKDEPRPLTPAEQLSARKAMLAMAYQDFFATEKGSKVYEGIVSKELSPVEYDRQMLNKVAASPKFIKATSNITHSSILNFMTDKKAPLKLMNSYAAERVQNKASEKPQQTPAPGRENKKTTPEKGL